MPVSEAKCDTNEGDGHADNFAGGGLLEAEEDGEEKRVDGRHADDDGRMRDRSAAEANGETELIDEDAEEAHVDKRPNVTGGDGLAAGAEGFGERGNAPSDGIKQKHEEAGENETESGESERVHVMQSDFAEEEIERPNDEEEGNGGGEDGARGRAANGGVYAHERYQISEIGYREALRWVCRLGRKF